MHETEDPSKVLHRGLAGPTVVVTFVLLLSVAVSAQAPTGTDLGRVWLDQMQCARSVSKQFSHQIVHAPTAERAQELELRMYEEVRKQCTALGSQGAFRYAPPYAGAPPASSPPLRQFPQDHSGQLSQRYGEGPNWWERVRRPMPQGQESSSVSEAPLSGILGTWAGRWHSEFHILNPQYPPKSPAEGDLTIQVSQFDSANETHMRAFFAELGYRPKNLISKDMIAGSVEMRGLPQGRGGSVGVLGMVVTGDDIHVPRGTWVILTGKYPDGSQLVIWWPPIEGTISGRYTVVEPGRSPGDSGNFQAQLASSASTSASSPRAPAQRDSEIDLTGTWTGTWRSSLSNLTGTVFTKLAQAGPTVSGTVRITGSTYSAGRVSGTVTENTVVLGMVFFGGLEVTYRGTISGERAAGSYSDSLGDSGRWSITRATTVAAPPGGETPPSPQPAPPQPSQPPSTVPPPPTTTVPPPVSAPVVRGVSPNPVPGLDGLQALTLTGSGFASGVRVILRTGGEVFLIPPDRTSLISQAQIQIRANVTSEPATWTAEVANPDGQLSNRFTFAVVATTTASGSEPSKTQEPPVVTGSTGNRPPSIEGFGQFRADGNTPIPEGGTIDQGTVVFKGVLFDPDGDQVRLEIELRQVTESFMGEPTPETISALVSSGSEVSRTRFGLVPANYRWQARAVDAKGAMSRWVEFGSQGNTDFTVIRSDMLAGDTAGSSEGEASFVGIDTEEKRAAFRIRGTPLESARVPVVLVHGWCGTPSEATWGQMQSLLGGVGINAEYANYGNNTEPDLARLAGRLSAEIERVLQDRALNPTGASQVDVVAHSMGGIVARALVANMAVDDAGNSIPYRDQIRKLIEIASPNYGVPFGAFEAGVLSNLFGCNTDFGVRQQQAKQLKFGSHFLWVLHGKWSTTLLAQERRSDVLTIVGIGNQFGRSDFVVPIESAALSDVGVRARYVDRTHGDITDVDASHETFSLVKHFLLTGNDPPESECGVDKCIRSLDRDTPGMVLFRLIDSRTRNGINLRTSFVTTVDGVVAGGEGGFITVTKNTDPGASTFTIRPLAPSPPPHSVIVEPVTLRYRPGELNGIEIAPGRTAIFGELALERE